MFWYSVDRVGHYFILRITGMLELLLMIYLSVRATVRDQAQGMRTIFSVVSAQIYFTGWQAMPLISLLAVATGGFVILQSSANMGLLGGTKVMGQLLVVVAVRELGPLITALVVVARSGTAVASEVGNMRANREIEALESVGINPLSYIVFPRVVGGVISVLCLAFYFAAIAIVGGFFVTKWLHNLPLVFYMDALAQSISGVDIWLFLLKNTFSGLMIFIISCQQGLSVKKSPTEVPVVTTEAVVKSIITVVVFNLTVTSLFYLHQLMAMGVL